MRESIPTGPHIAVEVEDFEATKAALDEMGVPYFDGGKMLAKLPPEAKKMVDSRYGSRTRRQRHRVASEREQG